MKMRLKFYDILNAGIQYNSFFMMFYARAIYFYRVFS